MSLKLGSQIRVATPEGDVYVAENRTHNHSSTKNVAFFTLAKNGKGLAPFVVSQEFLDAPDFSDNLCLVAIQLEAMFEL